MSASGAVQLEANLRVLEARQPVVAAQLRSFASVPDRGQWSISRSGLPWVRRDNVAWASSFDPVVEARRTVPAWDEADCVVLPSCGAGYVAEALVERYPDLPLILAEEDGAWLAEVLRHRDLTALLGRSNLVVLLGPAPEGVGDFLRTLACARIEVLSWRPAATASPQWETSIRDQVLSAQASARVNLATFRRFSDLWRRNLKRNERTAGPVRPLQALSGAGRGWPAVVVAAGPSLADQIDWLKAHRQRFLLLVVDTAWSTLAAHGFTPDVLLVLDGQYWNARHVDRPLPAGCLVVTEWTGPPRAFRLAPGRTFVAASSLPFLRRRERELWGELGALPSGGSVATAAWSLALHLGCTEVAFAGLDLGYPRGQTHVPGSQFEEAIHRRSRRLAPAEGSGLALLGTGVRTLRPALDGGTVSSDPRMDLFRSWLASSVAAHPRVRAINLGTRGSVVPGLLPPPPNYGAGLPSGARLRVPEGPVLRRSSRSAQPPFAALAAVLDCPAFSAGGTEGFVAALEVAWTAAYEFWGHEVWDSWAGRARRTWELLPSERSRRAVEEVVQSALSWKDFWSDD